MKNGSFPVLEQILLLEGSAGLLWMWKAYLHSPNHRDFNCCQEPANCPHPGADRAGLCFLLKCKVRSDTG